MVALTHEEIMTIKKEVVAECQSVFDGRYRKAKDCDVIVETEEKKIDELNDNIVGLKIEQTKTNTRLGVLIAILSAIAIPILGVCVKLLFGS